MPRISAVFNGGRKTKMFSVHDGVAEAILAERLRTTPDEAFTLLRRYTRDCNYPLTQLAADVSRGGGGQRLIWRER
jgi:hypothetical protein